MLASISPTLTPYPCLSHVRPPTPHASPPAPHQVHIHVPPVTRTSLPLFPFDNMLPQAEIPTKHVASPSNTGSNNSVNKHHPVFVATICTARDGHVIFSVPHRHPINSFSTLLTTLTPFEHLVHRPLVALYYYHPHASDTLYAVYDPSTTVLSHNP